MRAVFAGGSKHGAGVLWFLFYCSTLKDNLNVPAEFNSLNLRQMSSFRMLPFEIERHTVKSKRLTAACRGTRHLTLGVNN